MNNTLRILSVEDEEEQHDILKKVFSKPIFQKKIEFKVIDSFENAIDEITKNDYHIVILDIYRGKPDDNNEEGEKILETIQKERFIPIVFYSGNTKNVKHLRSQMVGVVTKAEGEGIENLKKEIERLVKSNLPFIREKIHNHLEKELKEYFWNIIHERKNIFRADEEDFSLGYLMLRKFGHSLSKEKIAEILGDNTLTSEKAHPMQFYIYPTDTNQEFECGEIIKSKENNEFFVILTPSCDFIETSSRKRKAERILLVEASLLNATDECKKYIKEKASKSNENELRKLINSSKSDRYFFLPKTPFIEENRVIDFQNKEMVSYEDLSNPEKYERIAKLDSPFAESMVASFIRYYNRIGFPDIDTDYILSNL
ncbi:MULTISPECIES: response regulator [Capnocytophaga]|uniref:response regulator n=1 Tax=Capnocytophaga TaxID=1016 RepID=UPI00020C5779|nr:MULTISPECIES: response regulator [unclassified Capnocytophaga]KHE69029.1 response regulator receiver domain protein [Capnocytophaga sp. oral taxon 329 str. F0087]QGS18493.1 response regulator [Capnocytophaga sp. FDAARGOS_737]